MVRTRSSDVEERYQCTCLEILANITLYCAQHSWTRERSSRRPRVHWHTFTSVHCTSWTEAQSMNQCGTHAGVEETHRRPLVGQIIDDLYSDVVM